jgi:crossover junction endodeoxyribonuclease RuvC
MSVSQARGAVMLCGIQNGLSVFEYTPLQIKQSITGYGRADKNQIQQMVKNILKLDDIPKPDDCADALACAITHATTIRHT